MKFPGAGFSRIFLPGLALCLVVAGAQRSRGQSIGSERSFPQSKAAVEKALKEIQATTAGRLPVVESFTAAGDHPLDRYQRGYYQSKFQVTPITSGGCVVRVTVEVTAWYSDPAGAHSGYQLLSSNGRLEADVLDQLAEQLSSRTKQTVAKSPVITNPPPSSNSRAARATAPPESSISAPVPRIPQSKGGFSSSLAHGLAEQEKAAAQNADRKNPGKDVSGLRAEADSLEETLKNQAHPKNLVAVKKSGTPVVATASLTAKTLFLASAHDEFEMLDFNRDWVHVRISGLSRGWIWRNNLEMPESVPDNDLPTPVPPVPSAADLFHVTREEKAPFPGDWAPLRGKTVKIVSVEKINESAKDSGPQLRLEFAKSVMDENFAELAKKPEEMAGIVLIFDSVDGGMIAATLPTLQEWKAGKLSDAALWHQCFFDPPETFDATASSGSR